jgi:hypothetical protein
VDKKVTNLNSSVETSQKIFSDSEGGEVGLRKGNPKIVIVAEGFPLE